MLLRKPVIALANPKRFELVDIGRKGLERV